MSDILKQEHKIFGQAAFASAWALWVGKGHDPASKLKSFTITNKDGSTGVAVGLVSYVDLESVHFPTTATYKTYAGAFAAIGKALDSIA